MSEFGGSQLSDVSTEFDGIVCSLCCCCCCCVAVIVGDGGFVLLPSFRSHYLEMAGGGRYLRGQGGKCLSLSVSHASVSGIPESALGWLDLVTMCFQGGHDPLPCCFGCNRLGVDEGVVGISYAVYASNIPEPLLQGLR